MTPEEEREFWWYELWLLVKELAPLIAIAIPIGLGISWVGLKLIEMWVQR